MAMNFHVQSLLGFQIQYALLMKPSKKKGKEHPAFSFKYFNIKNMDHIFVVRLKEHKQYHNLMIPNIQPLTKKSLPIKEKVKRSMIFKENQHKPYTLQPDTFLLNEASRIADLTYIHNENYYSSEPEESITHTKTLDIKLQTPISTSELPSSEALPQVWGQY